MKKHILTTQLLTLLAELMMVALLSVGIVMIQQQIEKQREHDIRLQEIQHEHERAIIEKELIARCQHTAGVSFQGWEYNNCLKELGIHPEQKGVQLEDLQVQ